MGYKNSDSILLNIDHLNFFEGKAPSKLMRNSRIRWLALVLASLNTLGSYFCVDNPQALENAINTTFNTSNLEFGLLYSVYGLPNIILPFFAGLIIDKLGVRLGISLFSFVLIIGQSIVALGGFYNNFLLMIIGRMIFALGGENLSVATCTIMSKWFHGKELSFSLAITLCVSKIGSSLNSFLTPKLFLWTGQLYIPLLIGALICLVSWLAGLILNHIDRRADKEEEEEYIYDENLEDESRPGMKSFQRLFYLLLLNGFFMFAGFNGLNTNLNDLLVERFGFDSSSAGNFIPIIYLIAAVFLPILGIYSDCKGRRVTLILFSSVIFLLSHFAMAFLPSGSPGSPVYAIIGPLIGIGIFYSFYGAIYRPCIPLSVPQKLTGTAFGIAMAVQNLGLTIIPLVLGVIHDYTLAAKSGYFWTEITLAIFVSCGIIVNIWIYFEDKRTGGKLAEAMPKDSNRASLLESTRSSSFDLSL